MRFKSFTAATETEALQAIRREMGARAVVLSMRTESDGRVRAIAALENPSPSRRPVAPAAGHDPAFALRAALGRHHTPEPLIQALVARIDPHRGPDANLIEGLERVFRFEPLAASGSAPVLLTGPPGHGKTAMAAKLALRARLAGHPLALICLDAPHAGGCDRLEAVSEILEIPLGRADSADSLRAAIAQRPEPCATVIDGEAVNPLAPDQLLRLSALIEKTGIEPVLVLAAGQDADEAAETARAFAALGAQRFIATRLDAVRRYGSLLSAAAAPLAFAEVSLSPYVPHGVAALTPAALARLLLHGLSKQASGSLA